MTADFSDYLGVCCRTEFTTPESPGRSRVGLEYETKVAGHLCELHWREGTPELLPTPTIYGPRSGGPYQPCPRSLFGMVHDTADHTDDGRQGEACEDSGKEAVSL